jgi:hypothetical protein
VTIVLGSVVVLLFDTIGSLVSKHFRFPYARLASGSHMIWTGVGAFAAFSALDALVARAAIAGWVVGLVDATLGWWISWQIGPGRPLAQLPRPLTRSRLATISILVSVRAAIFGGFGGLLVWAFRAST